jgi:5-methyltetrahydrofolate--homocysteine methyltransferase
MNNAPHNSTQELNTIAAKRILILDGAMGTMVQTFGLGEEDFRGKRFAKTPVNLRGCNDVLCLTRPDVISAIHEAYLEAGADIIETCSFNANSLSLADYGLAGLAYEISAAAAGLARKAADQFATAEKPRFVAGSMGPSNKSGSMSPDIDHPEKRAVTWDELEAAFYDNARGLLDGGADILLIETAFDTLNAKAAIAAIKRLEAERKTAWPLMISATVSDAAGRVLSGQTVEAFCVSVLHAKPWSVGLNCSFGAEKLIAPVRQLAKAAPCLISAHPNAGLPDALGAYDETPLTMCRHLEAYLEEGLVNVLGGCCGSTPAHIAAIAEAAKAYRPRPIPAARKRETLLAGYEVLRISSVSIANSDVVCDSDIAANGDGIDNNDTAISGNTVRSGNTIINNDDDTIDNSDTVTNGDAVTAVKFPFIRVGERTNVAGCKKFLNLVKAEKYEEASYIAQEMVEQGAAIINIGMDDPLLDAGAAMTAFLNLALADPEIARLPFMIDSSRWEVIEAGLKCVQGKALVNSISLKEGEAEFLRKARSAQSYGAAVVVMLFDEQGQAASYERKIEIAGRAFRLLTEHNFPAEDIVFDPNVLTIVTGIPEHDSYALAFIRACSWIREHCPGAQISGGISNLSFSFRGNNTVREAMHAVFLHHAAKAGLTMAIVNPGTLLSYGEVERELRDAVEDVILCKHPETAPERLVSLAIKIKNDGLATSVGGNGASDGNGDSGKIEADWRGLDAEARVVHAMIRGIDDFIKADVLELKGRYEHAFQIVEGPLMSGMKEVGDRFGAGQMYLPQVIRSARVMKKAVAVLEPFIQQERLNTVTNNDCTSGGVNATRDNRDCTGVSIDTNDTSSGSAKIILATVKGDVHDIGKNIVGVVLGCNGYDIIDLGVMVPPAAIIERAVRENAAAVGLSGLITPSLDEMVTVAREMERRGLRIPLLIGGATTSVAHTALRLAPEYSGPVVYVPDASRAAEAVSALLSDTGRQPFLADLEARYLEAAALHKAIAAKRETLSLEQARQNRFAVAWAAPEPKAKAVQEFNDYPLERVIPHIDWKAFLRFWEMNAAQSETTQAEKLLNDAKAMLDRVVTEKLLELRGVIGFFPAASENEDIIVYKDQIEFARFSFFRNQEKKQPGLPNYCLADFVAAAPDSKNAAAPDWIGLFALSAGFGLKEAEDALRAQRDDYGALLLATLANSLAEAFSAELHTRVQFWGSNTDAPQGGIRPAFGYPACPDHNDKRTAFALLDAPKRCGLALTESAMIVPAASVCGMYLAHPGSCYFGTGAIGEDQLREWAGRKGITTEEARKRIGRI